MWFFCLTLTPAIWNEDNKQQGSDPCDDDMNRKITKGTMSDSEIRISPGPGLWTSGSARAWFLSNLTQWVNISGQNNELVAFASVWNGKIRNNKPKRDSLWEGNFRRVTLMNWRNSNALKIVMQEFKTRSMDPAGEYFYLILNISCHQMFRIAVKMIQCHQKASTDLAVPKQILIAPAPTNKFGFVSRDAWCVDKP